MKMKNKEKLTPDEKSSLVFFNSFIKKHKRLPEEEVNKLVIIAKTGIELQNKLILEKRDPTSEESKIIKAGIDARNKIINHNLKLVINVALNYVSKGLEFDDLIQEGITGYIRAIELFNPDKENKLSTYAVWWIRQRITRALSNKSRMIRLPVHITTEVTQVLYVIRKYNLDVSYDYVDEISEITDFPKEKVIELFKYINSFYPINQVNNTSTSSVPLGTLGDEHQEDPDPFIAVINNSAPSMNNYDYNIYSDNLVKNFNIFLESCPGFLQEALKHKYALAEIDKPLPYKYILEDIIGNEFKGKSFNNIIHELIIHMFKED